MNSPHLTSKLLIFTDMDGCLLDHHNYSFDPASVELEKLHALNIPVIPATSKTKAEMLYLRQSLANEYPFIIENGAAVLIPVGYFPEQPEDTEEIDGFWIKQFTEPHEYWISLINQSKTNPDLYQTFSTITVDDIIKLTGLEHDAAVRASQRQYGEPVAWLGSEEQRDQFIAELGQLGANVLRGGRFLHVSGDCDKGQALTWLAEQYSDAFQAPVLTIAIGDSQNDIAMLEAANIAVLIPSPVHDLPALGKPRHIYTASGEGPQGWAESISMILNTLQIN